MRRLAAIFLAVLILTNCSGKTESNAGDSLETLTVATLVEETPAPSPVDTPALMPTPQPTPPLEPTSPPEEPTPSFRTISGVIESTEGFNADGSRPGYRDWLTMNIIDEHDNAIIIVVLHGTIFFPENGFFPGERISAYITYTTPEIIHDPPMYVALVVAGEGIDFGCPVELTMWNFGDISRPDQCRANIVRFFEPEVNYVYPYVLDYVFSSADFTVLDLPIRLNGEEIDSPPPILAADGVTVMVPFRTALENHLGLFSFLYGGQLRIGTADGGSWGASRWEIGNVYTGGLTPGSEWRRTLDTPPIIVDGIIYVSLIGGIAGRAPLTNAWLFDDRIEIYSTSQLFHGIWQCPSQFTEEEVAIMPIVVNSEEIDARPILYRQNLVVPLLPVLTALGIEQTEAPEHHIYIIDGEAYVSPVEYFRESPELWGRTNAKIHQNHIIIISY
jgi:hypothetical protein